MAHSATTSSPWSALPPELLHIVLRLELSAKTLNAAARTCAAWNMAVAAEPLLIKECTDRRFPNLEALLRAVSASPAPADYKKIYQNQLQALQRPPPKPRTLPWTLEDFIFTITIYANGVQSVQWTGSLPRAEDGELHPQYHRPIELWTEATAPSWAYDGDENDASATAAFFEALPQLTLNVMVSRACSYGVQSVTLCTDVPLDPDDTDDGIPVVIFDTTECPARHGLDDVCDIERDTFSTANVVLRPWLNLTKDHGCILGDDMQGDTDPRMFRNDDLDNLDLQAVLKYLSDVVPWN